MTNMTPILQASIALIAALVSAFLIPWLRRNTTAKEREELLKWVSIAVEAAQQLHYQLEGADRKSYVRAFLTEQGFDVDDQAVDAAIESAVLELHRELGYTR
ncbi:MAG: holin [Oscillospiraceae bacterium]|jgi:hypothetical protein|nr:holin [Oscillospiraceae bacterium]